MQLQLLEADGEEFEFVLHLERIRTQPELPVPTPKFYFTRTSQPSVRTEEEEQDTLEKALPPMFRDITNAGEEETITTFRKAPRVSVELREERRMTC